MQVLLVGAHTRKGYVGINLEFIQEFLKFVNGSNEKLKFENAVVKVAKSRMQNLCAQNKRNEYFLNFFCYLVSVQQFHSFCEHFEEKQGSFRDFVTFNYLSLCDLVLRL